MSTNLHPCAACGVMVPDHHVSEWMCSNVECMEWYHVGEGAGPEDRCPECGSEPLL